MICVGAVGAQHFQPERVGSTAAAVATSAHCPVAIIREHDGRRDRGEPGWIVVEADNSPHTGVVLEAAMHEARLRKAPLRIVTCWQAQESDVHDVEGVGESNRRLEAELDRQLRQWTRQHPELDVKSMALYGTIIDYLTANAPSVQLVVVGARDSRDVKQLLGHAAAPRCAIRIVPC